MGNHKTQKEKGLTLSEKLRKAIMKEVFQQIDQLLDPVEYEFGVHLYIEIHHLECGVQVGGR